MVGGGRVLVGGREVGGWWEGSGREGERKGGKGGGREGERRGGEERGGIGCEGH